MCNACTGVLRRPLGDVALSVRGMMLSSLGGVTPYLYYMFFVMYGLINIHY